MCRDSREAESGNEHVPVQVLHVYRDAFCLCAGFVYVTFHLYVSVIIIWGRTLLQNMTAGSEKKEVEEGETE